MVKNNSKRFKHNQNVARQINAMRTLYSGFQAVQTDTELSFVGTLQVRDDLPEYKIKIRYRGSLSPYVTVLSPKLVENPPHVYPEGKRLCLYHPDNYRWTINKLIAKEIVPWTAAWIYFYEYWLRTGEWIGPEAPHGTSKEELE